MQHAQGTRRHANGGGLQHLDHVVDLLTAVKRKACTRNNNTSPSTRAICVCVAAFLHAVSERTQRGVRSVVVILWALSSRSGTGAAGRGAHLNNENKLDCAGISALYMSTPIRLRMRVHALDRHHNRDAGGRTAAAVAAFGFRSRRKLAVAMARRCRKAPYVSRNNEPNATTCKSEESQGT